MYWFVLSARQTENRCRPPFRRVLGCRRSDAVCCVGEVFWAKCFVSPTCRRRSGGLWLSRCGSELLTLVRTACTDGRTRVMNSVWFCKASTNWIPQTHSCFICVDTLPIHKVSKNNSILGCMRVNGWVQCLGDPLPWPPRLLPVWSASARHRPVSATAVRIYTVNDSLIWTQTILVSGQPNCTQSALNVNSLPRFTLGFILYCQRHTCIYRIVAKQYLICFPHMNV